MERGARPFRPDLDLKRLVSGPLPERFGTFAKRGIELACQIAVVSIHRLPIQDQKTVERPQPERPACESLLLNGQLYAERMEGLAPAVDSQGGEPLAQSTRASEQVDNCNTGFHPSTSKRYSFMADVVNPSVRSAMMSGIRGKDTLPDMVLRKGLFARGVRYRLHDRTLPGCPDIVIKKHRAAIFVHGCFWHAHEGCRFFKLPDQNRQFWQDKLRRNQERDAQSIGRLLEKDWRVAVAWECAIRSDPTFVVEELTAFLTMDLRYLEIGAPNTDLDNGCKSAQLRQG